MSTTKDTISSQEWEQILLRWLIDILFGKTRSGKSGHVCHAHVNDSMSNLLVDTLPLLTKVKRPPLLNHYSDE